MNDSFVLHIIPVLCGLSPCPVALDFPRPKRETERERRRKIEGQASLTHNASVPCILALLN